jgi:hypothetical protein
MDEMHLLKQNCNKIIFQSTLDQNGMPLIEEESPRFVQDLQNYQSVQY